MLLILLLLGVLRVLMGGLLRVLVGGLLVVGRLLGRWVALIVGGHPEEHL